ncbi:hypothetical protein [Desulfonatronospira sp.]|uniref:hypothetical protein n=1 Tax=Desulfonatronospira sp. TaxID=1962951 RepID=UPI0025C13C45|nr:hypothetical protein [Desulfonatronospira sp.]
MQHKQSDQDKIKYDPETAMPDITEMDQRILAEIVCVQITPDEMYKIITPLNEHPNQKTVLAVHWHPEYIPMELIKKRIDNTFPNKEQELIIPTQHNELLTYDDKYYGAEIDCYSRGFQRKVQLLLHCRLEDPDRAGVLRSMLNHTYEYRSRQLFDLLDTFMDPKWEDYLQLAAEGTGVGEDVVQFARVQTYKLYRLLMEHENTISRDFLKNKLLRDFVDGQRYLYPDQFINRVQVFIKSVKKIVKTNFSLEYFYRTSEVIEEARSLGCGIVVPHPEQFWPILLCDYDIDGYEVWNPQSREYTEFLVNVIIRQNKSRNRSRRPLLVFMGDDAHLGEKLKDPTKIEAAKYYREIGVQPAWDDLNIRKSLIIGGFDRRKVMNEYKARLEV